MITPYTLLAFLGILVAVASPLALIVQRVRGERRLRAELAELERRNEVKP